MDKKLKNYKILKDGDKYVLETEAVKWVANDKLQAENFAKNYFGSQE